MRNTLKVKSENFGCLGLSITMSIVMTLIIPLLFLTTKMFEYSLWVFTGKDIPWYLDLIGGCALNGINLPIWIFSAIYHACGYHTPIFG